MKVRLRPVSEKCAVSSSVFRSYAVLRFQGPESIQKGERLFPEILGSGRKRTGMSSALKKG